MSTKRRLLRALGAATFAAVSLGALSGCKMHDDTAPSPAPALAPAKAAKPRFLRSPAAVADVAARTRLAMKLAQEEKRELLVYVGASWCEPCQYFHAAIDAGQLDAIFPNLELLELDADRDAEGIRAAGYKSEYIPLFAVPGADGRASGRQIEGSIKGDGAVAEITPRLRALLRGTARP